jgi:hypothetical protein
VNVSRFAKLARYSCRSFRLVVRRERSGDGHCCRHERLGGRFAAPLEPDFRDCERAKPTPKPDRTGARREVRPGLMKSRP